MRIDEDCGNFVLVGLEAAWPVLDPADTVAGLAGDGVCYACACLPKVDTDHQVRHLGASGREGRHPIHCAGDFAQGYSFRTMVLMDRGSKGL